MQIAQQIELNALAERPAFDQVYRTWFRPVVQWARALGTPDSELEDIAQEVFVVVERKLPSFDQVNLAGWLYRITAHTVSDQRRRAWFRRIFSRPRDVDLTAVASPHPGPAEQYETAERRRTLRALVDRMTESRRVAFWLFEVEGYSGDEIAALLDIPVSTVWMRLHHARKQFLQMTADLGAEERT